MLCRVCWCCGGVPCALECFSVFSDQSIYDVVNSGVAGW